MRKLLAIVPLFLFWTFPLFAAHIKGGEVFYEYLGPGSGNSDKYRITVRLFLDCGSSGTQIDPVANLGIFTNKDNLNVPGSPFTLPNTGDNFIRLTAPITCIVDPSPICYRVRIYSAVIELPREPEGFTAIFQRCCRINGIENIRPNNSVGASYTCQIHGSNSIAPGEINSNPQFLIKDTVLICENRKFELDFGAVDADGDSLSYEFCAAYAGGASGSPVVTNPAPPSQLSELRYTGGFSGAQPLGPGVVINPVTGIISGVAPAGGDYVVCVCLTEWRRGKAISVHRKDFNVRVDAGCDFAAASLKPLYVSCDSYTLSFENQSFSSLIHSYYWDFGVPGTISDTSSLAKPQFTYPDTGVYTLKLVVNRGEECSDSTTAPVKVFPGFFPDFSIRGSCQLNPFFFNDVTRASYGEVTNWTWDLGDETSETDVSTSKNPSWKYASTGFKRVSLTVESSKGCIATIVKDSVEVRDKPLIELPFQDTLICSVDTLQLVAGGGVAGTFSWQPLVNIINENTTNPLVFPKTTTTYTVTLNDNGCVNSDTVRVRVVDFVTLSAGADTTICLTDSLILNPASDALQYSWSPPATIRNPLIKNAVAVPQGMITYRVVGTIGKCSATDDITVSTVPYPGSEAGIDQVICYDDTTQLSGSIRGASYEWSPAASLINAASLSPLAYPLQTTPYVLTVWDNLGCPKPGRDTVLITVRPPILANAGNDTSIVVGQPLQLSATGSDFFEWSPPVGLNQTSIATPMAMLSDNITYYLRAYNAEGCSGYDTLHVKVFKTTPDIFVPNAFTPGRASNNRFRPIAVGMTSLEFFQVYNRWGQLIFSSNDPSRGWDGKFAGRDQDAGTYVWMVRGKDFTGRTVFRKGTMVLIR